MYCLLILLLEVSIHVLSVTSKKKTAQRPFERFFFKQLWQYSNPTPYTLLEIYNWLTPMELLFSCFFLNQPTLPIESPGSHKRTIKWHHSCKSVTMNKLRFHCFILDIWLAEFKKVGIYCFSTAIWLVFILCFSKCTVTLTMLLPKQEYKWVPVNLMLWDKPMMDSPTPSKGKRRNIPNRLMP